MLTGGLRRAGIAVIVGLIVFAITAAAMLPRSDEYDARVSLLASSASKIQNSSTDFGSVVALGLPAVVEVATSPTVLEQVSRTVAGSPGPDELRDAVTVGLIPGSGLVRITVRADSPKVASSLATAIADEVAAADLLDPAASLRVLDESATVTEASPGISLVAGLGLVLGVIAGAIVYGLLAVLVPAPGGRAGRALAQAGLDRRVAVITWERGTPIPAPLLAAAVGAGRPIRLVAADAESGADASELANVLWESGVPVTEQLATDGTGTATVALAPARMAADDLALVLRALPADTDLLAVILR